MKRDFLTSIGRPCDLSIYRGARNCCESKNLTYLYRPLELQATAIGSLRGNESLTTVAADTEVFRIGPLKGNYSHSRRDSTAFLTFVNRTFHSRSAPLCPAPFCPRRATRKIHHDFTAPRCTRILRYFANSPDSR